MPQNMSFMTIKASASNPTHFAQNIHAFLDMQHEVESKSVFLTNSSRIIILTI